MIEVCLHAEERAKMKSNVPGSKPLKSWVTFAALTCLTVNNGIAQECADNYTSPHSGATQESKRPGAAAHILINAPAHLVWQAIHEQRKTDPDLAYSKVISKDGSSTVLEQKFVLLPVIGSSICTMSNEEQPLRRIDYKLLKSDRFKAMEGSWVLTPVDSKSTVLELSSFLDLGIPGSRSIINAVTARKLERRLHAVKCSAETAFAAIAAK